MTITDVYEQYQIMPQLQTHMLRVAGVASLMCQATTLPVVTDEVVTACLLHDLGNIIKFDLRTFPEFLEPQGLEYWQGVQNDFFARFGFDEHLASKTIAQQVGASPRIIKLMDAMSFESTVANAEGNDWDKKICDYADTRVTPFGVVSLAERLQDLEDRYGAKYPSPADVQLRQECGNLMQRIEEQLFAHSTLQPEDINDQIVVPVMEELREWKILL